MMDCRAAVLTSARRPCLHFHCPFWFSCQAARAHVALLGPCFKTGRTRPSDYQRRWRTSGTHKREISTTVSTARSPHRTVHSRRGAPPYDVRHGGQGLPMFLGHTGASYDRAVNCPYGRGLHRITFHCGLVASV